ncbi:RNA polymerase subunit sigma-24 [Pontiella sulfatireligans]|uniref:Beta-barrel assembly-enhancing protease n=1 Tax=Pontiella sulfatireligans TaxID=2750658 RepID=A0A6C2UKZ6_9BACT|nr:RNA polymerase subunit sigma-24 [Pontiella sulfatireligans]VGO20639.1 hypothetical protein SCARR_02704 [Pontiella sulfatireligans]
MKKTIGIVCFGAAMVCMGGRMDSYEIIKVGQKLTASEVEQLERALVERPDDLVGRKKLLGYYWMRQHQHPNEKPARQRQVLWIIEHAPEDDIHAMPYGQMNEFLDGAAYAAGRAAWLKQIEAQPENALILGNASAYFLQADHALAEKFLKKAAVIDPKNPEWPKKLGQLYSLERGADPAASARRELEQLEIAYERSNGMGKNYQLKDMAQAAAAAGDYAKAKQYAQKMLGSPGIDWNSGNNVHHGNMVLGLVALEEGDVEEAKRRLIASGKTKGSPQLNSFGPNMTLAKALLEKGETEVVVEYFELCALFWGRHSDKLEAWTALAKGGVVPDFGANLKY